MSEGSGTPGMFERSLRWWERLGLAMGVILGLPIILLVAANCFILPTVLANTVINDTEYDAYCRETFGKFDRVLVEPGKVMKVDPFDCGVISDSGEYLGCLIIEGNRKRVRVSSFRTSVPREECHTGVGLPE